MKEMVNEIKLRELFDAEFEKQKEFVAGLFLMGERERLTIFKWFCLGFQHSYGAPLFAKVRQNMSEERHQQILQALREESKKPATFIIEPDNKSIFVYSWRSAQQRTMIILADSREEADTIFNDQFEKCAESPDRFVPTHYVTQLFVDSGESTIIYNN